MMACEKARMLVLGRKHVLEDGYRDGTGCGRHARKEQRGECSERMKNEAVGWMGSLVGNEARRKKNVRLG